MVPTVIYFIILIQLLFISYVDVKTRKISNIWPIINIILFIFCLFIFPDIYKASWEVFIYPVVFILVGFVLFVLKIMGAGDTKYLSSFFLLVPLGGQDIMFIQLAYSTLVVGVILFAYNSIVNFKKIKSAIVLKNVQLIKNAYGKKFAFTPVICISWFMMGILIWRNS